MLRPVLLGIALAVLAAACALVEAPVPPGSVMVQLQVANRSARPAALAVTTGQRAIPGAVRPPSVPAGATGDVAFFVPMGGSWTITVNGQDLMLNSDLRGRAGVINDIGIEVDRNGNSGWWCSGNCP